MLIIDTSTYARLLTSITRDIRPFYLVVAGFEWIKLASFFTQDPSIHGVFRNVASIVLRGQVSFPTSVSWWKRLTWVESGYIEIEPAFEVVVVVEFRGTVNLKLVNTSYLSFVGQKCLHFSPLPFELPIGALIFRHEIDVIEASASNIAILHPVFQDHSDVGKDLPVVVLNPALRDISLIGPFGHRAGSSCAYGLVLAFSAVVVFRWSNALSNVGTRTYVAGASTS